MSLRVCEFFTALEDSIVSIVIVVSVRKTVDHLTFSIMRLLCWVDGTLACFNDLTSSKGSNIDFNNYFDPSAYDLGDLKTLLVSIFGMQ